MYLLLFALLLQLPLISCRVLYPSLTRQEITIPGKVVAEGYVLFATVDKMRPLEVACESRDCKIHIHKLSEHPQTGDVRYRVDVRVGFVRIYYAGVLSVCVGPKDLFRKTPLIDIVKDVRCATGGRVPRLHPHIEAETFYPVGAYTWFMTERNYQDLREGNFTEVFVPIFPKSYKLPFTFGFCWHSHSLSVVFIKVPKLEKNQPPHKAGFPNSKTHYSNCDVYTIYIDATEENSGIYEASFGGIVYYTPISYVYEAIYKTVKITFFRGPKITLVGHEDHRVMFPHWEKAGTFTVDVYTTSQLIVFRVQRSDGHPQEQELLTEFVSYPLNSIIATYRVGIPWMKDSVSGVYTISVTNGDDESAAQTVEIERAQALKVLVSPEQQIVGEATPVSFECFVVGYPIHNVSWARDLETLSPEKYNTQVGTIGEDGRGLRLTFISPRLNDSGMYVCSAFNQFEKVQSTVNLAVFPPGSPYIDPNYEAEILVTSQNGTANVSDNANIIDVDLMDEFDRSQEAGKRRAYIIIGAVLAAVLVVGLLATSATVIVIYTKRRQQQSKMKSIKLAQPGGRKLLCQESRFQLIADTFRPEAEVVREWLDSKDSGAYDEEVGREALLKAGLENGSEDFETLDLVEDMDITKQAGESNAGYEQSQVSECTTKTKA